MYLFTYKHIYVLGCLPSIHQSRFIEEDIKKTDFLKHNVVLLFLLTLDSLYCFLFSFRFSVFTTKYTVHWGKYSTTVNRTKHDSMTQ